MRHPGSRRIRDAVPHFPAAPGGANTGTHRGDSMNIELTKKEFELLLQLVYTGNWVINSNRRQPIKKFDDLESKLFSLCKTAGLDRLAEYDQRHREWIPARDFEDQTGLAEHIDDYDEYTAMDVLIHRLAERDLHEMYGSDVEHMSREEWNTKLEELEKRYAEEFEQHDLRHLRLSFPTYTAPPERNHRH